MALRFLLLSLWLVVVIRAVTAPRFCTEDKCKLLFAPRKMYIQVVSSSAVVCVWRKNSHLRPFTCRCRRKAPNLVFWLLLLAGDVEQNPGPVRYPCTVCKQPVRCNQRGIECTRCENWSHVRCCGVSVDEYEKISANENELWYCPGCLACELPFIDATLSSISSGDGLVNAEGSDDLQQLPKLFESSGNVLFCHLNIRSLVSKLDELQVIIEGCKGLVLGISETWLKI